MRTTVCAFKVAYDLVASQFLGKLVGIDVKFLLLGKCFQQVLVEDFVVFDADYTVGLVVKQALDGVRTHTDTEQSVLEGGISAALDVSNNHTA